MIVVWFIVVGKSVQGEIMATYVLHGLSSSSPISSSEGMSRQPTLEWPNDSVKRPTVLNSGIEFQYGQYLTFSAHFDNQGSDQISVVAWIKRVKKDPGEFLRIGNNFTNASHPQGVGDIGFRVYTILEDDGNIGYRTKGVVNRADISEEYIQAKRWFAIGVGWSQDQAYFKKRKSYPADYGNIRKISLPVTSWTSGGSYYIGCLNVDCDTNSKIIIHSIRVYNDIDPTISLGLADIPFNEYFPCGNGEIETFQGGDYVEECDDGGWANNDGCDEFCIIESGWTCVIDNSTSQSACTIDPVTICQVDHCSICSGNDSNICQKCEDGYQLFNESTCQYEIVSETAQQMSTTTQAMTGLGAVASLGSSILNASSPGSLWAMVNQLQLLFFLLLTQSSLPTDVRGYITGNSLFSFDMDFGFLPLKDNRLANIPLDWMKKNQTNIALKDMGQESGSSFNNNFGVFIALILLALFHSVLFCVPKKYDYTSPTCKGRFMKATGKLWRAFSFGIYLRFMLEAYQNILLSVVNELKNYDFSSLRMIFSTGTAILLLLLLGLLVYLSIREAFRISDPDEHSKCGELTNGLRSTKLSQIYTTILILRRVV